MPETRSPCDLDLLVQLNPCTYEFLTAQFSRVVAAIEQQTVDLVAATEAQTAAINEHATAQRELIVAAIEANTEMTEEVRDAVLELAPPVDPPAET